MLLIYNPSTLVACANEFACSSSWFVRHNSVVTPYITWDFFPILFFPSSLAFSWLKLLTFSSFQSELFGLDWVSELVLIIESKFSVDTARTRRLLTTATSCACGKFNSASFWRYSLGTCFFRHQNRLQHSRLSLFFSFCSLVLLYSCLKLFTPW